MKRRNTGASLGIRHELKTIVTQTREVWKLIPWRYRLSLAGAVGIMSISSTANTAIPLCLGKLIDVVDPKQIRHNPYQLSRASLLFIWARSVAPTSCVK